MKIIKQYWEWLTGNEPDGEKMLRLIEQAGRVCYKSEERITGTSHYEFVKKAIAMGHLSIIEHANISVRIITDRGVTHEIVRHRLASYSQESTRYCNYSQGKFGGEITVILPVWFYNIVEKFPLGPDASNDDFRDMDKQSGWEVACKEAEYNYLAALGKEQSAQEARAVLPNSLKTEIIMTCNVREWRHFFTLRCSTKAHPQMQEIARSMLRGFREKVPVIFDDICQGEAYAESIRTE